MKFFGTYLLIGKIIEMYNKTKYYNDIYKTIRYFYNIIVRDIMEIIKLILSKSYGNIIMYVHYLSKVKISD